MAIFSPIEAICEVRYVAIRGEALEGDGVIRYWWTVPDGKKRGIFNYGEKYFLGRVRF